MVATCCRVHSDDTVTVGKIVKMKIYEVIQAGTFQLLNPSAFFIASSQDAPLNTKEPSFCSGEQARKDV